MTKVASSNMLNNKLEDFKYELPEEKIPDQPLQDRSASKLLVYNGEIQHSSFKSLPGFIPDQALLFLNNTKVIPARIFMQKSTGANIEIFLLKPLEPFKESASAMQVRKQTTWQCMIGNKRKWKKGDQLILEVISERNFTLTASYHNHEQNEVTFEWSEDLTFSEVLEFVGEMPLPPYMNRRATDNDKPRYQTVYSINEGAVAAPTAGLHFTNAVLADLKRKNVKLQYLTLHVSAGTFQPIKTEKITDHPMHYEQVIVTKENLSALIRHEGLVIPIGTTSMRTLESLYWYGIKWMKHGDSSFFVDKLFPYQFKGIELPNKKEVFQFLADNMESDELKGGTEIFIFPGYTFRVCDALVTNFHMPGSTLLLLIAAFVGDDWKKIYDEALQKDYRFLSYGDSSLLFKNEQVN